MKLRTQDLCSHPIDHWERIELCHPSRIVHIVNKILDAFRKGERDSAEFWIQMGRRFIYIRYSPLGMKAATTSERWKLCRILLTSRSWRRRRGCSSGKRSRIVSP